MRKRRIISAVLIGVMLLSGCAGTKSSQTSGDKAKATIKFAYGEDKILQSYEGTSAREALGERFVEYLVDDFEISAFRNEYESRQVILTAKEDIAAYEVSVGDFVSGENTLPATTFEVCHEYYHEISTIYSSASSMATGMYPDAVLPMEAAKEYGLNTIKANENQAVLITVHVPKEQATGVYKGDITIKLDDETHVVKATVEVLDYTLPDEVYVESSTQMSTEWLMDLQLDDSQEMYDKVAEQLNSFGLSVQFLSSGYARTFATDEDYEAEIAKSVEKALEIADNPAVNSFGIKVRSTSHPKYQHQLDEASLKKFLTAYVDKSVETGVDILKKGFVYMGTIIDEPDAWGEIAMERVDYVCTQYNSVLAEVAAYAKSKGATQEMIDSINNLTHVVTTYDINKYQYVDRFCPEPQYFDSLATVEDFQALWDEGRGFWWYTCCNPKTPYPTTHVDDNGVSARVMYWMMREYGVEGFLIWETLSCSDHIPEQGSVSQGMDMYEDMMRHHTDVGDGQLFYPGRLFELETPVPAIRLYYLRDGIEDYDAITDLQDNLLPALSATYGADISAQGILDELYGSLYALNKVYCTSVDVNNVKNILNTLMVWADDGIAVSDYKINSDGTITAKIYAPENTEVKIDGNVAQGTKTAAGNGNVYEVSAKVGEFDVEIGGRSLRMDGQKMESIATLETDAVEFEYETGTTGGTAQVVTENGKSVMNIKTTANVSYTYYEFEKGAFSQDDETLILYIHSNNSSKVKMSIEVYGSRNLRSIETVYLQPGDNVIRLDRTCDLEWKKIGAAEGIRFTYVGEDSNTVGVDMTIEDIVTIKAEESR